MLHHLLRGHRCGEIQLHRPFTLLATGHGNNPSAQSPRKRPQPPSRITSAALCSYRSYNSTARLRCSLEYLATMTTPPAQGVQQNVTTPNLNKQLNKNIFTDNTANKPAINRHTNH